MNPKLIVSVIMFGLPLLSKLWGPKQHELKVREPIVGGIFQPEDAPALIFDAVTASPKKQREMIRELLARRPNVPATLYIWRGGKNTFAAALLPADRRGQMRAV